jgi:hypothetical protein
MEHGSPDLPDVHHQIAVTLTVDGAHYRTIEFPIGDEVFDAKSTDEVVDLVVESLSHVRFAAFAWESAATES